MVDIKLDKGLQTLLATLNVTDHSMPVGKPKIFDKCTFLLAVNIHYYYLHGKKNIHFLEMRNLCK